MCYQCRPVELDDYLELSLLMLALLLDYSFDVRI